MTVEATPVEVARFERTPGFESIDAVHLLFGDDVAVTRTADGRLAVDGHAVSVAHTKTMLVVASTTSSASPRRVGIDIEQLRPRRYLEQLARRAMTPVEFAMWESTTADDQGDRTRAFLQHWTRVEAYLKAIGSGIRGGLRTRAPNGWSVVDLDLRDESHVGAVAIEAAAATVTMRRAP